ncbi:MAG TPA: cation:dicarboxylase symporter family transporter, partial [Opitutus sp.]|nr:cation:dicarboxylase symporter family transporter [Opitutus sp.]
MLGLAIGVVAGAITLVIGAFYPPALTFMRAVSTHVLDPFGQIFLRMLFFVVIPLVFASLASGVTQLGRLDRLGPLAVRTFGLFALNMIIGVALGLLMMNVLQPGDYLAEEAKNRLMAEYGSVAQQTVQTQAERAPLTAMTIVEMFMPKNLFGAFVGNSRGSLGDVL